MGSLMLSDLRKYISNDCTLSSEEEFIRYILQHCRNQSVKQHLIDGIRGSAADLMYDHDDIFNFFNYSQHIFDVFDDAETDIHLLLLAYFHCIFDEDEFYIQTTCSAVTEICDYYIGYPAQLKRSSEMVDEILEVLIENSNEGELKQAIDSGDSALVSDLLYTAGWEDWYIDTTEIYFSDEIQSKIQIYLNQMMENLGIPFDENGVGYYWRISADGEPAQNGEPQKNLASLIETSEKIRKLLGRGNCESDVPYKDVIRVFEEAEENNDLIIKIGALHDSGKEVLF